SGQLAFTYTNAYVNYGTFPNTNGLSIVTQVNQNILNYNSYTKFCATNAGDVRCKGGSSVTKVAAAPCYVAGAPDPTCALAGTIANPYWNAPAQPLLARDANYVPYDIFPGGIGSTADGYNVPYVATLILNYKHNKIAITPSFQFQAGGRYGAPQTLPGIAPDTCKLDPVIPSAGGATIDPGRYPYGALGGNPYDAAQCGSSASVANQLVIPDNFTGSFDLPGSFRQPSQLLGNLQVTYEMSQHITLVGTFANLIDRCFGGSVTGFTATAPGGTCSYGIVGSTGGLLSPVGNIYNPGQLAGLPNFIKYPYEPTFGASNVNGNSTKQPFNAYFSIRFKI
ncbi:MAG: hypothetical protein M3N19_10390, partial [Candidatus Eremiobacteraeota bacterium]|nr:hypothetical protein [Candidatus Eremiobacteraeota bacterium]